MTTRFDSELLQHLEMLRDDIVEASRRAGQQASGRTYSETTATVERTGDIIEGAIRLPDISILSSRVGGRDASRPTLPTLSKNGQPPKVFIL